MALSKSVEESLREAESHLRNALAFAARQESPYVSCVIADMISKLDQLIQTDKFLDKVEGMMKKYEGGENPYGK
jgi:hypothetical protein